MRGRREGTFEQGSQLEILPCAVLPSAADAALHYADMPPSDRIVLASASPRRAELLRAAGIDFDVQPANVDETIARGESPGEYVSRVAEAKARLVQEWNT